MVKLYIYEIAGKIYEREPGHWVATSDKWGLTTHGKSAKEADLRMSYAIHLFADVLGSQTDIEAEFVREGISYTKHFDKAPAINMDMLEATDQLGEFAGVRSYKFVSREVAASVR